MSQATTLSPADVDRHAEGLAEARRTRRPVAPLTDAVPDLTAADAYAIAQRGVARRLADGAVLIGHKIGLTAPAVQAQLGVDQPDYGSLLDEMAIPDGATVDAGAYIAPRIELELAFRLRERLTGPGVTAEDVRRATGTVSAALELVDSRIRDWRIRFADTVADAASSAAFVLGADEVPLAEIDPADVPARLLRGGELVEAGHTSAVLGDPCASVAWLANALAALGETLAPGHVILSGACTRMVDVRPGDAFRGELAGVGAVSVAFAGERA